MPHEFQTLLGPTGPTPNGLFDVTMTEITAAQIEELPPAPHPPEQLLQPTTVLHMNQGFRIHVIWSVTGRLWGAINGQWDLHAYLESMGPGPELELTDKEDPVDHIIPFTFGGPPEVYDKWLDVNPNVVDKAGAYKLVVTLTYINNANQPDQMAGWWEGPMLQFYP